MLREVLFHLLAKLAWGQHGAFSTTQALDIGVSSSTLSRYCKEGSVVRRAPAVYVLAGTPDTDRQRVMVHVLAAGEGSFATADTGVGLWCDEVEMPRKPIIVVPRSCGYASPEAIVRRSTDLHLAKPGVRDGIPVVGVARALLDASHGSSPDVVLRMIEACRRSLPMSVNALLECLHVHARQGRPGIAVFREALCRIGAEVTDSEFERLVVRDLVGPGLPEPRLHHVVQLAGEDPIELDLDWPPLLLDVELDGLDHVDRVTKAQRDRQRDRRLKAHGWDVPRFMWREYVTDPAAMIDEIVALHSAHVTASREVGVASPAGGRGHARIPAR